MSSNCYWYVDKNKTVDDATSECQKNLGQLGTIYGEHSIQFVKKKVLNDTRVDGKYWTGIHDISGNGPWVMRNGSAIFFDNWAVSEGSPSNGENCMAVSGISDEWYDEQCSTEMPFLCESVASITPFKTLQHNYSSPILKSCRKRVQTSSPIDIEQMVREMRVARDKLSQTYRKRMSMPDDRISSKAIGSVSIVVILIIASCLFFMDFSRLFMKRHAVQRKKKVSNSSL